MTDAIEMKKDQAFEYQLDEVYRKNYDMLVQTAYRVVRDREHAENVVHDVFKKLIRSGPPEDFGKNPRGYLYKAVIHQGISFLRSRGSEDMIDESVHDPDLLVSAADWEGDANMKLVLREALSKLDPALAAILSLHYWDGYDLKQIAEITGRSRPGVAMTMVRARRELKKLMSTSARRPRREIRQLKSNPGEAQ